MHMLLPHELKSPLKQIVTLRDFKRFGILLEKFPRWEPLTSDTFQMTVDRDDVYEDLLRFFVKRESKISQLNTMRLGKNPVMREVRLRCIYDEM